MAVPGPERQTVEANGDRKPAADDDKPVNRRTHLLGTTTTAVATILAAVLGAVLGGLGGAWYGALAADARSENEFFRDQKISAYAQFLGAVDAAKSAQYPYLPLNPESAENILAMPTPSPEARVEIEESLRAVETSLGQVFLVSDQTVEVEGRSDLDWASQVLESLRAGRSFIHLIEQCRADPTTSPDCDGADPINSLEIPERSEEALGYVVHHASYKWADLSSANFAQAARAELHEDD